MNNNWIKKLVLVLTIITGISFTLFFIFIFKSCDSIKFNNKPIFKNGFFNISKIVKDNKVKTSKINDERKSDINNVYDMEIESNNTAVNILKSQDGNMRTRLHGNINANFKPAVTMIKEGNTLSIKVAHPPTMMTVNKSDLVLDIYIPESYLGDLNITNDLGSISSKEKFNFKNIQFTNTTGNIEIKNMTSKMATVNCDLGNILIDTLSTDKLNFKVSSGNITLDNFKGNLSGKADLGKVTATYTSLNNDINLEVSTGNILLNLPKDSDFSIDASCNSGKISCSHDVTVENNDNTDDDSIDKSLKGKVLTGKNKIVLKADLGNIDIK